MWMLLPLHCCNIPTSPDFITRRISDKSLWDISVPIFVSADGYLLNASAKVLTWKRYVMENHSALLGFLIAILESGMHYSLRGLVNPSLDVFVVFVLGQTVEQTSDFPVFWDALTLIRLNYDASLWHDSILFWMLQISKWTSSCCQQQVQW